MTVPIQGVDAPTDSDALSTLDSLLVHLGGFSRLQMLQIVSIGTIITLCAFSQQGYIQTTSQLNHRCLISECESENASYGSEEDLTWLPSAIPTDASGRYDSCLRYHLNHSAADGDRICSNATFSSHTYKCDRFVYDTDEWTIHREDWGIHCDSDLYLLNLVGSINNLGQVGGLLAGYLQDKFGRQKTIVTMALLVAFIGVIKSFSASYTMMLILEGAESLFSLGLFAGPFTLAMEIVPPKQRAVVGLCLAMAYPLGTLLITLVQYLTFNWRNTLRICYGLYFLAVGYYWLLPESVRWLLNRKKYRQATAVLQNIAQMNGKELPPKAIKSIIAAENAKQAYDSCTTFKEMIKSSVMTQRALASIVVRASMIFIFAGITLNYTSLQENKFVDYLLTELIEMPGVIIAYIFMERSGRKPSGWFSLFLCGISCISNAYTPIEWQTMRLVLFLLGKLGAAAALFVSDVYITEIFPTAVRSTMCNAGIIVGKVLCVFAPHIPPLASLYGPLPMLILGTAALIGAVAMFILPETLHRNLPDTVDEAEKLK